MLLLRLTTKTLTTAEDRAQRVKPAPHPGPENRKHQLAEASWRPHSLIAIRTELVEKDPELPTKLYGAFAMSKQLHRAEDPNWTTLPRLARQARIIGSDPVPYGLVSNAASIAALRRYS